MFGLKPPCLDDRPVQSTILASFIVHQDSYCGCPVSLSFHDVICLYKIQIIQIVSTFYIATYLFFKQEREREPKSPPHGNIIESVYCKIFEELK